MLRLLVMMGLGAGVAAAQTFTLFLIFQGSQIPMPTGENSLEFYLIVALGAVSGALTWAMKGWISTLQGLVLTVSTQLTRIEEVLKNVNSVLATLGGSQPSGTLPQKSSGSPSSSKS